MKSVDFPEANTSIAKDQPQYSTLYGRLSPGSECDIIVCFELTEEEIRQIVESKKLWYSQRTFGQPYSPMLILTENPFKAPLLTDRVPVDENRVSGDEWDCVARKKYSIFGQPVNVNFRNDYR